MANKTYQGRIVQKHDSSANWAKATNFIPLKGEIIIYDDLNKIKIGDGTTKVNDLDFSSSSELPEGGTAGQLLTKTADGQEWQDREKDVLVVNMTMNDGIISSTDKTFDEVRAAYNTGKTVIADLYSPPMNAHYILPSVAFQIDQGIMFAAVNGRNSVAIVMSPTDIIPQSIEMQNNIVAKGILKGNGDGGISSAVAGTDYMAPPTGGTAGQVLTKTANSSEWADAPKSLPEGGTDGDALVKSTDGGSWETPVEATLVSLPTGILKSDGTTISQAIAGIDYMSNIEGNFVTYKSITETENTTSINANTLDGHGSNYYATANSVTTLGDRVTTNETNIYSLQENIANINVVPTNHSETVLTSQDLNNYNTLSAIGWYYAAGDNTVVNKPSGVDAFGLEVGRSATGWFYQILKSSNQNTNKIYIRNYDSSIATWSNWSRLVSDSELPPTPKTYSGILSSNSWATSGNYKTQTITIPGLRSSYSSQPIIDAQLSGTDADGDNAVLDAWSAVNYANTATNSLTAMCIGDAPEVNIPILINVME